MKYVQCRHQAEKESVHINANIFERMQKCGEFKKCGEYSGGCKLQQLLPSCIPHSAQSAQVRL